VTGGRLKPTFRYRLMAVLILILRASWGDIRVMITLSVAFPDETQGYLLAYTCRLPPELPAQASVC